MALRAAAVTGAFCVVFAYTISVVAPQLNMWQLLGASFISGFLGSLFARFILGR